MTLFERRIHAEWDLLLGLASLNPHRITGLQMDDATFRLNLHAAPALQLHAIAPFSSGSIVTEHSLYIEFPVHYPVVPLTLHLVQPVLHPNIHPSNGFACLWSRHHLQNNVEHALHKLIAMLSWRLYNTNAEHIMQPNSLTLLQTHHHELLALLHAEPLKGLTHHHTTMPDQSLRRTRLS